MDRSAPPAGDAPPVYAANGGGAATGATSTNGAPVDAQHVEGVGAPWYSRLTSPADIVALPTEGSRHCSRNVCWCSAGFWPTHMNDAAVGPDAARIVADPGASALVPPTDASIMRTCTSSPSNVPLICTVKFCASEVLHAHPRDVRPRGGRGGHGSRDRGPVETRCPRAGNGRRAAAPIGDPHGDEHDERETDGERCAILLHLDPPDVRPGERAPTGLPMDSRSIFLRNRGTGIACRDG